MASIPSPRSATSPAPSASVVGGTAGPDGGPSSVSQTLQKSHSTTSLATLDSAPPTPPRPPRNPARADSLTPQPNPPRRPSTATGTRKEVTPWEFSATGKLEDVLPWEEFPAPAPDYEPVINGSPPPTNHIRQSRASISSSLQDMALLRRRKSTGTKAPNAHPTNSPPVVYTLPNGAPRISTSTNKSPSSSPKFLHKTPSASTVRPPLPKASSGPVPTVSSLETTSPPTPKPPPQQPHPQEQGAAQDPKFSTADRTILKELKRNISARAAQFVIKGGPAESGKAASGASFMRLGAKHHAWDRDEVPYPRSYAREVLDLDIWETMANQSICNSLTWHAFATPPTRVLDVGCGTGTWILNCGMAWRNCHFVGLDIVPVHPNLGASDLATRITWVQANFLEGLPFPNDEFDFVHIKRVALGVPEDKWDALFEEIARVLKPGGAFELIEEDLFFPGKAADSDDDDSDSDNLSELRYARPSSEISDIEDDDSVLTGSGGSRKSYEGSAPTPNTSLGAIPDTPPRTASPLPIIGIQEDVIEEAAEEDSNPSTSKKPSPAHPSFHRHSYQARLPFATLSPGHTRPSSRSTPSPAANPQVADRRGKTRGYSTSTLVSSSNQHPSVLLASTSQITGTSTAKPNSSFLLRSGPKPPTNPRDHSLLKGIYNEMNATRFINLSPLSLLANLVGLHFKDVRTHPPLQLTFPPPTEPFAVVDEVVMTDDETDSDDARDAIIPRPRRHSAVLPNTPRSTTSSDTTTLADEPRWLNTSDLLKRESRYVSLDDARMSAFSPSTRSSFPASSLVKPTFEPPVVDGAEASSAGEDIQKSPIRAVDSQTQTRARLPNATFNIDVRSLNMHLALRVAEIIACSESMWEWVVSYQKSYQAQRAAGRPRAGSLASEIAPRSSRLPVLPADPEMDAFKSAVLELTREDFDALLVRFDMDMGDHIAIGSTLRDQFSWPCIPFAPSQERKAFHAACERWEQWQGQQQSKSVHKLRQRRNSVDTVHAYGSEGNGADRHGIPKFEVLRGRTSLPETRSRRASTGSSGAIPPERRLSRSIRVFVAWKP